MSEKLEDLSKEEVADIAAMLFNYQLLGPAVLLELAEKYPWLVERAPSRWEMEAILDLARRGLSVNEADPEFYRLARELKIKYQPEDYEWLAHLDEVNPMLNIIAAIGRNNHVIGLDGEMPWKLNADLQRFKRITTGHTVVMGRKTWESIPEKFRPLPNRQNIVLTRNKSYRDEVPEGVIVVSSLDEAIELHRRMREQNVGENWGDMFVIGGESVFAEALFKARWLYLTIVDYEGPGDTVFPEDPEERFQRVQEKPWMEETLADDKNTHTSWFCVMENLFA